MRITGQEGRMKIRVLVLTVILIAVPVVSFRLASAQTSRNALRHFRLQITSATALDRLCPLGYVLLNPLTAR
jgi:hypothetical protein